MSSQGRGELRRIDVLSWLRGIALCGLFASLIAAAGCGVPKVSNPFGAGSEDASSFADDRLPERALTPTDRMPVANAPIAETPDGAATNCPQVVAWPNERLRTVYQQGHDGDQDSVIHRGEITKLSRECQFHGGRVVVKYGFAGRVLLGPKGKPGAVTMPVSIRAAGADKQTLATDKMSITATVPADTPVGYFSMVREISFPVQVGTRLEDYKVFVALK